MKTAVKHLKACGFVIILLRERFEFYFDSSWLQSFYTAEPRLTASPLTQQPHYSPLYLGQTKC